MQEENRKSSFPIVMLLVSVATIGTFAGKNKERKATTLADGTKNDA